MARRSDIREYVDLYVDTLLRLYDKTDPKLGSDSEVGKHELAQKAIEVFWYLHGKLLIWAQAHLTGYAILSENPNLVSYLEKKLRTEITEDSHVLEQIGLQYPFNPPDDEDRELNQTREWLLAFNESGNAPNEAEGGNFLTPTALRTLIVELLMSRSADNSYWRMDLQQSLRALNEGEVDEVSQPRPGKRQGLPYSLLRWKLEALRQVRFRVGQGMKKYRALEEVGQGIGQSPETLRGWEKELERSHDRSIDLYCSELAGLYASELKEKYPIDLQNDQFGSHRGLGHLEDAKYLLESIENRTLSEIAEKIHQYRQKKKGD
jgi:hypothetical protein